jgi:hypothetical protein
MLFSPHCTLAVCHSKNHSISLSLPEHEPIGHFRARSAIFMNLPEVSFFEIIALNSTYSVLVAFFPKMMGSAGRVGEIRAACTVVLHDFYSLQVSLESD